MSNHNTDAEMDDEFDGFEDKAFDDSKLFYTGLPLFRGLEVDAVYSPQNVPSFRGNPCIEALPPEFATDLDVAKALREVPKDFAPELRNLSSRERIHCLGDIEDTFFQPLARHFTLQFKISRMLRRGYVKRNPTIAGFYKQLERDVNAFPSFIDLARENRHLMRRPKAHGFHLLGPSGIGKTYSLESILYLYPQVIRHRNYQDKNFALRQLVWLKLDCPHDALLGGLAKSFLEAADEILGTTYTRGYVKGRSSIDDHLRGVARVAGLHCLGALVVDEIQMLRAMRGENSIRMLNFFVNLANTIGVPILLSGTDRARQLFSQRPSQARRGTGQGAEIWHLMRKDAQWDLFLNSLFKFQYIRQPVTLNQELSDILFEHSQGITDIVVKLFIHAQIRAMITEDERARETLTAATIRSVALDDFVLLRPVIDALRRGDQNALLQLEDIYPQWRDEYEKIAQRVQDAAAVQSLRAAEREVSSTPPQDTTAPPQDTTTPPQDTTTPSRSSSAVDNEVQNTTGRSEVPSTSTPSPASQDGTLRPNASSTADNGVQNTTVLNKQNQPKVNQTESLLSIVAEGKKNRQSAYQSLKQASYTFSLGQYLDGQ